MKKWYAVYTRCGQEKKVVHAFVKRKIEAYSPLRPQQMPKQRAEALFPGYVFVRLCAADLDVVRSVEGVTNMVYWLDAPVVIRDVEMDLLQGFLQVHAGSTIEVEQVAVDPDAIIAVSKEPTALHPVQRTGGTTIVSWAARSTRLLLPSLGFYLHVQLPQHNPMQQEGIEELRKPVAGRSRKPVLHSWSSLFQTFFSEQAG